MNSPLNPVRIFVSRAGQSNNLRLRDNRNNLDPVDFTDAKSDHEQTTQRPFDTLVDKGNVIIWELDPRAMSTPPEDGYFPIKSIDNVALTFETEDHPQYRNSEPVLEGQPVSAGNSFVALVPNPSLGAGKFANYKIEYTLPDNSTHVHDPKILLNS